jgi:Lipopolysaccharide kinase (Kdo/WaaP) family.
MKIVINPEYDFLREWIEQVPSFFEDRGEILYKGRNLLKVFNTDNGVVVNVKRYRTPAFFNRIVYSFFRKSKAARSYQNTLKIAEKGFETARAIAYIEIKQGGLLSHSFFISLQCIDVKEIRVCNSGPLLGNEKLIEAFTCYSASLHDAGIYHLDYSPGNILYREDAGKYTFTLVDLNRMKFMPVNYNAGCKSFSRLFIDDEIYKCIGNVYSGLRYNTLGEDETTRLMINYKNNFWKRKAHLKRLKKIFCFLCLQSFIIFFQNSMYDFQNDFIFLLYHP